MYIPGIETRARLGFKPGSEDGVQLFRRTHSNLEFRHFHPPNRHGNDPLSRGACPSIDPHEARGELECPP
jgi:hypothetical protein